MKFKLGIIGSGNMATAIAKGIIKSNIYSNKDIIMSDINEIQRKNISNLLGINTTDDNDELIKNSDIILFAIKPQYFEDVTNSIDTKNLKDKFLISIMAGTSIEKIKKLVKEDCQIARVMPNTPALVNEAMSAICLDKNVNENNKNTIITIFESIGNVKLLDENLIDAVTAISGSSPAYVFMMIEAMADGGVLLGLSRDDSYTFAAQTLLGSAKMYLETKTHPAILKDMVCSPAGTTIEAVKTLEQKGFRSSIIDAMYSCFEKSKNMNKK